jgi:uncharacterized protein
MPGPGAAKRVVIVAPQSGQAVSVGRGEEVRVVDPDGGQVGDMWAIDAADHGRWLSASHTRDRCERLFPAVGEQFRDQHGEPVLRLAADTSPGVHDMLFPPCDRWLYESRGLPGHVNCRDNFLAAAALAGIRPAVVPDPVNLFQNSGPQPDGRLRIGVTASRPGDAICFLAERDLIFVLTACSVDYPPLSSGHCGPLRIEVTPAGLSQHAQRPGAGDGLGAVGRSELAEDVADVFLDRGDGYDQLVGDLLVGLAGGHQPQLIDRRLLCSSPKQHQQAPAQLRLCGCLAHDCSSQRSSAVGSLRSGR